MPTSYFVKRGKPIPPDVYLRAEEAAVASVSSAVAACRDIPAMLDHIEELRQEHDHLSSAVTHPGALRLVDRIAELEGRVAELERSEVYLKAEIHRLQVGQETLRNAIGKVRAKVHGHGQKIRFLQHELKGVCDGALQATRPRAWQATHRDANGMFLKQLFEAVNVDADAQIMIHESLDGRKWASATLREASQKEVRQCHHNGRVNEDLSTAPKNITSNVTKRRRTTSLSDGTE